MKIAFVTTQSVQGSTVVGRVLPLAEQLAKSNDVHVLVHESPRGLLPAARYSLIECGRDPFARTGSGKKRLQGLPLIARMVANVLRTIRTLRQVKADVVVIVKPLPQNVLAIWLYTLFSRNKRIVLDADDFELSANVLTSLPQRAAVHWSERRAAFLARTIIAATPFLADHFEQLTHNKKQVVMIPTGIVLSDQRTLLPAKNIMLYLGSVSISSGHRVDLLPKILKEAREQVPGARLRIAGDGDDVGNLKHQFADRGLEGSVDWLGRFSKHDIPALLADVAVILDPIDTSIANRAKSSFRTALAGISGIPVVTSNVGIRPYLLPLAMHARCFAAPADSPSYAEKVISFLRIPLRRQEQHMMREHAMRYTWDVIAAQYEKEITI